VKNTDLSKVTDKLYHIMLYTSPWSRFELTTSVVIGTDCIVGCRSNYHVIMATTTPRVLSVAFLFIHNFHHPPSCRGIVIVVCWGVVCNCSVHILIFFSKTKVGQLKPLNGPLQTLNFLCVFIGSPCRVAKCQYRGYLIFLCGVFILQIILMIVCMFMFQYILYGFYNFNCFKGIRNGESNHNYVCYFSIVLL
jgi:hypothetical protein